MPAAPSPKPTFTVYKFKNKYDLKHCIEFGPTTTISVGTLGLGENCLKYETKNCNQGDLLVINNWYGRGGIVNDGTNPPYVNGVLYQNGKDVVNGSVPLSVLAFVASGIPMSDLNTYIDSNSVVNKEKTTQDSEPNGQITLNPIITPKKIFIGIVAIGAVFGLLKWTKVI